MRDWFKSLSQKDRLLAVSTIDPKIVQDIKFMFGELKKRDKVENGKFKMISNEPGPLSYLSIQTKDKKHEKVHGNKINHIMMLANPKANQSRPEVVEAEMEFMDLIRITDTLEMHDTLTVNEILIEDPDKFYILAERIVGSNYLKIPIEILWMEEEDREQYEFETQQPCWMDMTDSNSLAAWILYYLERAIMTQFQMIVHG